MSLSPVADSSSQPATNATEPHTVHTAASLWPALIAEGIGTFGLVFAGCGAIMVDGLSTGR